MIVVQVGLTGRYHTPNDDSLETVLTSEDEIIFGAGVRREEDSRQEISLRTMPSGSPSFTHNTHV